MLEAFHIAASGMHAQQLQVDVIANNLANVNTPAFKKSKVSFEDLMYRQLLTPAGLLGQVSTQNSAGNRLGSGTAVTSVTKIFSQGEAKGTGRMLDIAIQGSGFLELALPDGRSAYTRAGSLQTNTEGMLMNMDGYFLNPAVQVPPDAESVLIKSDGTFLVKLPGEDEPVEIGRIELANFLNPAGLTPVGDNLYVPSNASGDVFFGEPGEEGFGSLAQGFLEGANVDLVEELTSLVVAQRSYEMNAKVIQAADDMLSIVNNLRR